MIHSRYLQLFCCSATIIALLMFATTRVSRAQAGTGSIAGTITTAPRALPPVRITIDQRVCGNELPDEAIVANPSGGLANAVITLAGAKGRGGPSAATVMNEKCRFSPRVQIVRPNATVTTSSVDPMLHTTNAQVGTKTLFNVALPMPNIKISKPVGGPGIVRLTCNTHPWMRGWMIVTDDIAVVTAADGKFALPDVPPGTYELRVWHEALKPASQKVTVSAGQTATVNLALH